MVAVNSQRPSSVAWRQPRPLQRMLGSAARAEAVALPSRSVLEGRGQIEQPGGQWAIYEPPEDADGDGQDKAERPEE